VLTKFDVGCDCLTIMHVLKDILKELKLLRKELKK